LIPGGCAWKHTLQINHICLPDPESNFSTVEDAWKDMHWHGICSGKLKYQPENMNEYGVYTDQQYTPDSIINFSRKKHTKKLWK
jgi:hypothetical protein